MVAFPGGLESYVANPAGSLDLRPEERRKCGRAGRLHCHSLADRSFSLDSRRVLSVAYRVQCRRCGGTTRLLPEGTWPHQTYSVETIGAAVQPDAEPTTSYRSVALEIGQVQLPEGLSGSRYGATSSCLRFPARSSAG